MKKAVAVYDKTHQYFRYITMIPEMEAYSGVKTFRVLRALKTISTVKGTVVACFIP